MNTGTAQRRIGACLKIAVLALGLLVAAPLATRFGLFSYTLGLPLTALAVLVSALLLLAALLMLALPALRGHRGRLALLATIALLPVAAAALVVVPAAGLPVIHDISTDLVDPPSLEEALARRGPGANPLERTPEVVEAQRAGYPALAGLDSDLDPDTALQRAEETAVALGWDVHGTDAATGILSASETTFWFGFTDDVAVRVRAGNGGSRIELRSVSRVGRGDLGANAGRIERFLKAFASRP